MMAQGLVQGGSLWRLELAALRVIEWGFSHPAKDGRDSRARWQGALGLSAEARMCWLLETRSQPEGVLQKAGKPVCCKSSSIFGARLTVTYGFFARVAGPHLIRMQLLRQKPSWQSPLDALGWYPFRERAQKSIRNRQSRTQKRILLAAACRLRPHHARFQRCVAGPVPSNPRKEARYPARMSQCLARRALPRALDREAGGGVPRCGRRTSQNQVSWSCKQTLAMELCPGRVAE